LHAFLSGRNPEAAKRAIKTIRTRLKQLSSQPRMGRKFDVENFDPRELVIEFGTSGYIALYWQDDEFIYLLAIRHQRESGY
jgi:plasmid stabilization system protein ParE